MKRSLSFPALLCGLLSALLVLSLLPILRAAKYDLPSNDDLEFVATTQAVWDETHSFAETAREAAAHTRWKMETWQGTYSAQFLMALQPGLFGLSYYAVTPYLMLGLLILSFLVFYRCVCRRFLGTDRTTPLVLALFALICCIQFPPSAAQGFFWFNGGVFYTAYFALTLLLFSLLFAIYQAESLKKLLPLGLLSCLLSAFVAGGCYTSMLPAAILMTAMTAAAFVRKRRGAAVAILATLIVFFIGMYINISAPGNEKRIAFELAYYGSRQTPPVKAILLSLLYGVSALLYRFDGAMLLNILLTCALLGPWLRRSRFSFQRPLFVLLLSVGVFCAAFTPTLYAGSSAGPLRSLNIVYFAEFPLVSLNAAYLTGYVLKKRDREPALLCAAARRPLLSLTVSALLLLSAAMGFGVHNTTSVLAVRELSRGVARAHYEGQLCYLTTGERPSDLAYSALLGSE